MNFESRILGDSLEADDSQLKSRRRMILIAAGVLLALVAIVFYMSRGGDEGAGANTAELPPVVTVTVPGRISVATTVNATGTLAARREMPVGVVGEGGSVTRVLVEPGQWVRAGQVLAQVERSVQSEQRASLAAQLQVARADASLAQSELDRAQALVARGFISKADIDRKTAARDAAAARVRVAQAQLKEQAARIGRLDIRAPAAGLVLTRAVEPGQVIGASSGVLFRMAKGGEMEMLARVGESDLVGLSVGQAADVTPVGGTKSFTGHIWQVSPVIDPQTRQGTVRVALSYARELRPGGFASARIVSGGSQSPVLPESAIMNDEKGNFVYIVNGADKVERRDIRVGQVSAAGVTVNSGLTGSERVVTLAGGFLTPGQKVKAEREGAKAAAPAAAAK